MSDKSDNKGFINSVVDFGRKVYSEVSNRCGEAAKDMKANALLAAATVMPDTIGNKIEEHVRECIKNSEFFKDLDPKNIDIFVSHFKRKLIEDGLVQEFVKNKDNPEKLTSLCINLGVELLQDKKFLKDIGGVSGFAKKWISPLLDAGLKHLLEFLNVKLGVNCDWLNGILNATKECLKQPIENFGIALDALFKEEVQPSQQQPQPPQPPSQPPKAPEAALAARQKSQEAVSAASQGTTQQNLTKTQQGPKQ